MCITRYDIKRIKSIAVMITILEETAMITINERLNVAERNSQAGLLTDRVEQDLSDALSEFGSASAEHQAEQASEAPRVNFGYGIPMAGVRYYSFTREG